MLKVRDLEERVKIANQNLVKYKADVFQKIVGKKVCYITSEGTGHGYIYDYVNAFGDDCYIVTNEQYPKTLDFPDTFAYVHPSFLTFIES